MKKCLLYLAIRLEPFLLYLHLSLPTLQGGDSVGKKEAGLPDILGQQMAISGVMGSYSDSSGAFKTTAAASIGLEGSDIGEYGYNRTDEFKASYSCSIYGNSTTVQPPALSLIPQIKF